MEEFLRMQGGQQKMVLPEGTQLTKRAEPPEMFRAPMPSPEAIAEFRRKRDLDRWIAVAGVSAFLAAISFALLKLGIA